MVEQKTNEYGERLMRLETKIDNVENKIDKIENKLDDFVKCSDTKYATKKELNDMKVSLVEYDKLQDHKWSFIENNWFGIILTAGLIIYAILKSRGLI